MIPFDAARIRQASQAPQRETTPVTPASEPKLSSPARPMRTRTRLTGLALTGALVAGGGIACTTAEGNGPGANPAMSSGQTEKPKRLVLKEKAAYMLGDSVVSIVNEGGVQTGGTAMETERMKTSIEKAKAFGETRQKFTVEITKDGSTDRLTLPIEVMPSPSTKHAFAVVGTEYVAGAMLQTQETPGGTRIDTQDNTSFSALVPVPDNTPNKYGVNMNPNTYNAEQQSFNNMVKARVTVDGDQTLQERYSGKKLDAIRTFMETMAPSSLSSSYGLAAAMKEGGYSYADYKKAAEAYRLKDAFGLNINIHIPVLSATDFNNR